MLIFHSCVKVEGKIKAKKMECVYGRVKIPMCITEKVPMCNSKVPMCNNSDTKLSQEHSEFLYHLNQMLLDELSD